MELLYFFVAKQYNIIDKPNLRSSHSSITLRGGGIVFYFGAFFYFLYSGLSYSWFFLGLTLMAIISFLDDIFSLSNRIRLMIHFCAVLLMAYQLDLFSISWYYLLFAFIVIVGVINAYNFMDGINGITAIYSLSVFGLLLIVNSNIQFISQDYLIFSIISLVVFAFFNFRNNAITFAGDVGSVSIAYILLFALGLLILKSGNFIYILFLAIYGLDSIWTIIQRLRNRENIFEAHRSHLYQYLANERGINKLIVASIFGLGQFFLGLLIIWMTKYSSKVQFAFSLLVLIVLSILYLVLKDNLMKNYIKNRA